MAEQNNMNDAKLDNADTVFKNAELLSGSYAMLVVETNTNRILHCTNHTEQVLGYSLEEISQKKLTVPDIIDERQQDQFTHQTARIFNTENAESQYVMYSILMKDGRKQMCFLFATPPAGTTGIQDYYIVLIIPDLSGQELPFTSFDSRRLFLEKLSNFSFGTFEWIVKEDKVFWSDGIYKVYELDKETPLTYDAVRVYSHPDDRERAGQAVANALKTGEDYDIEMRIITPANKVKIISASGRVLKDEHGNVVKMVGSVLDITGQKQIETDLKKTVAELYRSNKELEEFAYVASHDLHEPLRKITTFSEKLFDECNHLLTEEGRHYLDRIKYSADNMTKLIDNLLEFSLLNQYSDPYGQESLNTVLKEVLEDLDLLIEETGAILQVGGLPELECSHSQMKQLFVNLINNAIKFRKSDVPAVVNISGEVLKDEEKTALYLNPTVKYYKIVVSDNGIGFKQEYADVIFQIFKRLYGRSTYAGSGIGLAICKKICDHHKGVIYAEGEPGVGAKFIVVLPEKQEP